MTDTAQGSSGQRLLAVVVLLAAGVVTLPLTAYFFDDEGSENWILPVAFAGMALLGALVGALLPGLAGAEAPRGRSAGVGALVGIVLLVVGVIVFFLILNGFDGA